MVLADLLREEEDVLGRLGREAEQKLASLLPGDSSFIQVTPVVGIEILVHSAE